MVIHTATPDWNARSAIGNVDDPLINDMEDPQRRTLGKCIPTLDMEVTPQVVHHILAE